MPWLVLLAAGIALRLAAPRVPVVRDAYAGTIYPLLSRGLGALTGWVPFSIAEIVAVAIGLGAMFALGRALRRVRLGQRRLTNVAACGGINLLALAGLGYGGAMVLWGGNYYRTPFAEEARYDASPAAVTELRDLAAELVEATNATRGEVLEENGVMRVPDTPTRALGRARLGFERASQTYEPLTRGYAGRAKRSLLFSTALSYLGLSGVFVPFTGEPTVNGLLPDSSLPFTACHEIAHQMGYAREDEASFVGFLAATRHPDPDYRYSGYLAATRYVLAALGEVSPDDRRALADRLRAEVRRDLAAQRTFWDRYDSPVTDVGERVNDLYLKAQGQAAGTRSYGEMVDLLVAHRRSSRGSP